MSKTRTRTDLLNLICEIRKPQRYLEIGIQDGENFKAVNCAFKYSVDIDLATRPNFAGTSDRFFATYPGKPFDLIFIDGDHSAEQTAKDIKNAGFHLNTGGLIVCHDALPHNLKYTRPEWCGDGYRAIMAHSEQFNTDVITYEGDHGCAIFRTLNVPYTDIGYVPRWDNVGNTFENLWANDADIVNKSTWEEVEVWLRNLK